MRLLSLLVSFGTLTIQAQDARFIFADGTILTYPVNTIRSQDLIGTDVRLSFWNGDTVAWPMDDIDRSDLVMSTTGIEPIVDAGKVIFQQYPNPTAGATWFKVQLEEAVGVRLEMRDGTGRLVMSHDFGSVHPGPQTLVWDGRGTHGQVLTSGLYSCALRMGSLVAVGRIVIER